MEVDKDLDRSQLDLDLDRRSRNSLAEVDQHFVDTYFVLEHREDHTSAGYLEAVDSRDDKLVDLLVRWVDNLVALHKADNLVDSLVLMEI